MINFKIFIFILYFFPIISYADFWYGEYHNYYSEEISVSNIAIKDIKLLISENKCEFNISGFQVDKNYMCYLSRKKNKLYIYNLENKKLLGIVVRKGNKYYLNSNEIEDQNNKLFYKLK